MQTILSEKVSFENAEYIFDNGAEVVLFLHLGSWEYSRDQDGGYICGTYEVENNAIIDWDGCFNLPEEVMQAFKQFGFDTSNI